MKRLRSYALIPLLVQTLLWPILAPLLYIFGKLTVENYKLLSSIKESVIIVANHPNQIDPFVVRAALPWISRRSPLFWLSRDRKTYGWTGWRKYIFTDSLFLACGAPIAPSGLKDYSKALKTHVRVVYDGYDFNFFPQAGEEKYHGNDAPVHGGVAYLAHATGAPIVITAILGTKGLTVPRMLIGKHQIKIVFGEVITTESLNLLSDSEVTVEEYKAAARAIMKRVHELKSKYENT